MMILNDNIEVFKNEHGKGMRANHTIPAGTPIFKIKGKNKQSAEKYTIQIDESTHIDPENHLWGLINHSCEPNCIIDFTNWTFVTLLEIKKGEEFTFNYLTTEWEMSDPFDCVCGMSKCTNKIKGFKFLSEKQRLEIIKYCSPFISSTIGATK